MLKEIYDKHMQRTIEQSNSLSQNSIRMKMFNNIKMVMQHPS